MLKQADEVSFSQSSDASLLIQIKNDSKAAFGTIYNRYWGLMYVHAYKMLGDEDEAKDVVQELFTYIWEQRTELEQVTSLKSYLYTALRNRVLNIFDKRKVRESYIEALTIYFNENPLIAEDRFHEKELITIIEKEITNLPEKMRNVFELSRKQNLSHKEIASELQISDKTVKKQINNAIRILKLKISYLFFLLVFIR